MSIYEKTKNVIGSCKTPEQLMIAGTFLDFARRHLSKDQLDAVNGVYTTKILNIFYE